MKRKHPHHLVLDSKASRERNKADVEAALALLAQGTDHLPVTQVEPVSDAVGRGLYSIGHSQSHLGGTKTGMTTVNKI